MCRFAESRNRDNGDPFSQLRASYLSAPPSYTLASRRKGIGVIRSNRPFPARMSLTIPVPKDSRAPLSATINSRFTFISSLFLPCHRRLNILLRDGRRANESAAFFPGYLSPVHVLLVPL